MTEWPGQFGETRARAEQRWEVRAWAALCRVLEDESDRWFLWVPVCFGVGVGLYFALSDEPAAITAVAFFALMLSIWLVSRSFPIINAVALAGLCVALGFGAIMLRTNLVAEPVLERSGVMTLKGWVERTERRGKAHRITLRVTEASRSKVAETPSRVRITSRFEPVPATGAMVEIRARLLPVPDPVIPGGFDFSRKAFYTGLGAVGFVLSKPVIVETEQSPPLWVRFRAMVDGVRHRVEDRVEKALPGLPGAIVMALITGERGLIPEETLQTLRHSGLAHLLAISGMHMALMAGGLYWLLRALAAAVPSLALRYPIKKWAAVLALAGGVFYLLLSGGSIATQRAFLMMTIVFAAILLDRPALTLRNVALAACVILLLFPESLLDVSFQMSFAAVTGLVAVYERLQKTRRDRARPVTFTRRLIGKSGWYMGGIALTTLVASIAVAPFAAYHFHKLAQYGLLANLAAMPVFGLVVMPAALITILAMPFGLESVPLQAMAWGVEQITDVAARVSAWDGAVIPVAAMPIISLLALVLGGLWLCLWRTRWRLAGLGIASIGILTAGDLPKPDILIDRDGELIAARAKEEKLSVTGARASNYSLEQWLRSDGDMRTPETVLKDSDLSCDELACVAQIRGKSIAFVRHPAALEEECRRADIVIAQFPARSLCPKARVNLDRINLWAEGAHALYLDGQSIRVESVAEKRGNRPWNRYIARKRKAVPDGTAFAGETEPPNE